MARAEPGEPMAVACWSPWWFSAMRATSEGTMIAAPAPASAWAAMTHPTDGAVTIMAEEAPKTTITERKIRDQPTRRPSFAPTITSAATTSP